MNICGEYRKRMNTDSLGDPATGHSANSMYRGQCSGLFGRREMEDFVTTATSKVGLELGIARAPTASGGVRVAGMFRKQAVYACFFQPIKGKGVGSAGASLSHLALRW